MNHPFPFFLTGLGLSQDGGWISPNDEIISVTWLSCGMVW